MTKLQTSKNIENRINELLTQYDAAKETDNKPKVNEVLGKIEVLLDQLEENTWHVSTENFLQ